MAQGAAGALQSPIGTTSEGGVKGALHDGAAHDNRYACESFAWLLERDWWSLWAILVKSAEAQALKPPLCAALAPVATKSSALDVTGLSPAPPPDRVALQQVLGVSATHPTDALSTAQLTCSDAASSEPETPPRVSEAGLVATVNCTGSVSRGTSWMADSPVPSVLHERSGLAVVFPEQQQSSGGEPFWACSSWSFGSHSDQNKRTHMEDLTNHPAFDGCKRAGFFAVFDGHAGYEAAEYLQTHLLSYVLSAGAEQLRTHPLAALDAAVKQAEDAIVAKFAVARCNAGSTLLALLLVDDKLYFANVGDSRALLGRGSAAQQLTRDHKPTCSVEQQRIGADDPAAEISCDGYIYGELAVARAVGSAHLKQDPCKRALIPTPDLISVQLQAEDDFIVLATDGLWDEVDNAEVVSVARRSLASSSLPGGDAAAGEEALSRAAVASQALVDRALRRSSQDNISVIVLLLHGRTISLPKSNSMLFKRRV